MFPVNSAPTRKGGQKESDEAPFHPSNADEEKNDFNP